ncbi:hypothetical protein LEP1GSC050_3387 [Leptospira broomii serovar Hurstbridge str. 5399]|uniref:Uncharacterized protein n=1 Tax=Leptospira broomii serovar Hurstbridge str. 5399 TaxID=1049789 RepID=T0GFU8_9LEPT|nr:hypothetical protein LEP1GSC050_3387 [Leptospira broomii serovar Hurstbridge str. 5399]
MQIMQKFFDNCALRRNFLFLSSLEKIILKHFIKNGCGIRLMDIFLKTI